MNKAEMQDLVDCLGTMFREYLETLEEQPDEWQEGYMPSPRSRARDVLEGFLSWVWKDYNG